MELEFEVVGEEPVPKQSFRYGSGRGRHHIAPRVVNWQNVVGWAAVLAKRPNLVPDDLFHGPVAVFIEFRRYTKRRADLDNLQKGVLDALKGILFKDDSQVIRISSELKHVQKGKQGCLVRVIYLPRSV